MIEFYFTLATILEENLLSSCLNRRAEHTACWAHAGNQLCKCSINVMFLSKFHVSPTTMRERFTRVVAT